MTSDEEIEIKCIFITKINDLFSVFVKVNLVYVDFNNIII